jgi:uncharacterized protein YrzB (UPF0473 family)
MKFRDEDGNVVELEAVARVYVEEQEYLVLAPLDENSDDEFVFRVDKDSEGKEELNAVEDDEEFQKVKKEYKNLLYGEVE